MKITKRQLRKGIREMIHEQFNDEISVEEDMFRAGEDDAFDGKFPRMPNDHDYMQGYQQAMDELESQQDYADDPSYLANKGKFDGRTVAGFKEGKKMKITKRQLRKLIQEHRRHWDEMMADPNNPDETHWEDSNPDDSNPAASLGQEDHWDRLYDALETFVDELRQGDADFDEDAKRNIRNQINSMLGWLGV